MLFHKETALPGEWKASLLLPEPSFFVLRPFLRGYFYYSIEQKADKELDLNYPKTRFLKSTGYALNKVRNAQGLTHFLQKLAEESLFAFGSTIFTHRY